jgi:hypothetical protein
MQAIVADTTPQNYLVLNQAADILPNLYRTVLIPPAVKAELAHANTPAIVRAWISQPPPCCELVGPHPLYPLTLAALVNAACLPTSRALLGLRKP